MQSKKIKHSENLGQKISEKTAKMMSQIPQRNYLKMKTLTKTKRQTLPR